MENLILVTCPRCLGSGKFSFNLQHGDVCFKCTGKGKLAVDGKKYAKAKALKEKRAEAARVDVDAAIKAGHLQWGMIHEKYKNDSRLGSAILEKMEAHELYRADVYRRLQAIDAGLCTDQAALDHLAQQLAVELAVPYSDRKIAKEAGAKWNGSAWFWPESANPLPDILEKYKV